MMILNNRDEISFFFFFCPFLLFPFVLSPLRDCMLFLVMEEEEGMI
jgi:hypothetical protein